MMVLVSLLRALLVPFLLSSAGAPMGASAFGGAQQNGVGTKVMEIRGEVQNTDPSYKAFKVY